MPIPGADHAFIPPEKLWEYLLNLEHPVGGPKAQWFVSMGYDPDDPRRLEADLLAMIRRAEGYSAEMTAYGVKYVAEGSLTVPIGRRVNILTVWILDSGATAPRFVTAYPIEETLA
ncbi:MAG: hypothetical protein HY681_13650 [Chloroflexi bacterium]|nr:hypothetical protein [Chloroflexota bacterium]